LDRQDEAFKVRNRGTSFEVALVKGTYRATSANYVFQQNSRHEVAISDCEQFRHCELSLFLSESSHSSLADQFALFQPHLDSSTHLLLILPSRLTASPVEKLAAKKLHGPRIQSELPHSLSHTHTQSTRSRLRMSSAQSLGITSQAPDKL